MMAIKHNHATPCSSTAENKYHKNREPRLKFFTSQFKHILLIFSIFILTVLILFLSQFPKLNLQPQPPAAVATKSLSLSTCDGGVSVYVYDLPPEFNVALLRNCSNLNVYTDMCPHVANNGLGQPLAAGDFPGSGGGGNYPNPWYATNQFMAETLFHARVENHPCRTHNPSKAEIFYVPFYGGLHASSKVRESNHTVRDELSVRLIDYLESQPMWKKLNGADHFMVLGRTAWDFMRSESGPDFGANSLLNLPTVKNMTVLIVERHPWVGTNQHGIPYSTYFHPFSLGQVKTWQCNVQKSARPYLFSFIGATRKGVEKAAIRDELIYQCGNSTRCKLIQCDRGSFKCYDPSEIIGVMKMSQFCLQAAGDSFTRRSTFDSILAGCIPVFFSPHTAYTQYGWYLPGEGEEYSVFLDEKEVMNGGKRRVEEELMRIPAEQVERMRRTVVGMIPRLMYAHPNASSGELGFKDAVDVALEALTNKVRSNTYEKV